MPFRLVIPRDLHDQILSQAQAEQPNECCGLLAGKVAEGIGRVVLAYPLPNSAQMKARRYLADTHALLRANKDIDERGLEILAVYHSHPTSPAVPSATDHEQWGHGEEVVCLIITLLENPPVMHGWWMMETEHREAEWGVE
jgi:proteasome lid subunit RPN8/RPN11